MKTLTNSFIILLLATTALAQEKPPLNTIPLIRSDKAIVFYAGEELGYYIMIIDGDETSLIIRCKTLTGTKVDNDTPTNPDIPKPPAVSKYGLREQVAGWYANVSGENKKEEAVKLGVVFFAMVAGINKGDFGDTPTIEELKSTVGKMNRDIITEEARRVAWLTPFFTNGFGKSIQKLIDDGKVKTKKQYSEAFQEVYLGLMEVK